MKLKLHWQILIAILVGGITGWLTGEDGAFIGIHFYSVYDFFGTLFLNALKMLIVPLISSSIIVGVAGIGSSGNLGRLGGKTIGFYFMTTLDFITYTPAVRVGSINQLNVSDPTRPWLAPHSCLAKSVARSHDGSRYVMLTTCADEGIRPMVAVINEATQGSAGSSLAPDSFTPQQLMPAFCLERMRLLFHLPLA